MKSILAGQTLDGVPGVPPNAQTLSFQQAETIWAVGMYVFALQLIIESLTLVTQVLYLLLGMAHKLTRGDQTYMEEAVIPGIHFVSW